MKRLTTSVLAAVLLAAAPAFGADAPGVTKSEIRIGQTTSYSGPASQYGLIGRTQAAFFKMLNEQGGINGRRISLMSVDDAYSPPKSMEQMRKLVEQEGVAFMFNSFGAPTNAAQQRYLNSNKIPQLFVATGSHEWGDVGKLPWSMGFQPSFRSEAVVSTLAMLKARPGAKIGLLYQNDDMGRDMLAGIKEALGSRNAGALVAAVSYESADPTVDSQMVSLQASGADTLVLAAIPKFAAQALRKMQQQRWAPVTYLANGASGVDAALEPVRGRTDLPLLSSAYLKNPLDPTWKDDTGLAAYREFMKKHLPDADANSYLPLYGYTLATAIVQVLRQCGNDLSRENIMRQASSLKDVSLPTLLPGVRLNTSANDHFPIEQMQMMKWNGSTWELYGAVVDARP